LGPWKTGLDVAGTALEKRGLTRGARISHPALNPNPQDDSPESSPTTNSFREAPAFPPMFAARQTQGRATVPLNAVASL
jgi:hypothetical protein